EEVAAVLGEAAGVVVLDLVVVPGQRPGAAQMGGLEVGVGLVLGVAEAVLVEGLGRVVEVVAHGALGGEAVLVDVVAEEDDEVDVGLGGEVAVAGVVAVAPLLTRADGDDEAVGR